MFFDILDSNDDGLLNMQEVLDGIATIGSLGQFAGHYNGPLLRAVLNKTNNELKQD
jgi:hypothetical protein